MVRSDPTTAFKTWQAGDEPMALTVSLSRRFDEACRDAAARGLLDGAVLVSRDGVPLAGRAPGAGNLEVFAAMHATALGAAEVALAGIGASTGVSLLAEFDGRRFVSRGLDRHRFVVASVCADADCHDVFAWMDALAGQL